MANAGIPPPPPGYTLEGGAGGPPPPPPGYTLESDNPVPAPPKGYTLEAQKPSGDDAFSSFTKGAVRGAAPAMAGLAGATAGAEVGATLGLATGPGAIVASPVLGIGGALVGGFLAATGANRIQEEAAKTAPGQAVASALGQTPEQIAADKANHPIASELGEFAPNLAAFRPSVQGFRSLANAANAAERAGIIGARVNMGVNAGLNTAQTAYQEMSNGQDLDPTALALAAGEGLLSAKATRLGRAVTHLGETASGTPFLRGVTGEQQGFRAPVAPIDPDVPALSGTGMTPAETSQYHQVLMQGSHEDIHNFFQGLGIEPPRPEDINEWISRRDAVNEGIAPPDYADEMFHPQAPDMRDAVKQHIDKITEDWDRKPDVEVINHTDDIADPEVRAQAKADGADDPEAYGFYGADGKVRIFANKLDPANPEAALHAVLYHEALGHHGLATLFGDRLNGVLETLAARNVGQFGMSVKAKMADNPGMSRPLAAEEVLAEMSEKGPLKKSIGDAITAHVRLFARKMGIKLGFNDAEVREIIRMAHQTTMGGKRDSAVLRNDSIRNPRMADPNANPMNKFMFTGRSAKNFNEQDPTAFRAPDGFVRNEVSDSESKLLRFPADGPQKMSDILKHDRLYAEYPQLADMTVHGGPYRAKMGLDGGYAPSLRSIVVDNTVHPNLIHGALLHEIQHAIQHIEGHSNGVKGDDADVYRRSLGEIEARSVEARRHIAQEDLSKSRPYASEGVRRDEVIVTPPAKDSKLAANQAPGSKVDISAKRGEKDNGEPFRPIMFHGGANFDTIDAGRFGSGEPGGIRPLGKDKLYGSLAMSPEEIPTAIQHARMYSKYGGSDPTIHAFHADIEPRHLEKIGYDYSQGQHSRGGEPGKYELEALPWRPNEESPRAVEAAVHPDHLDRIGKWSADTPSDQIMSDLKGQNKFMRRARAASKDYVAEDLEGIYRGLDANYVPQTRSFEDVKRDALAAGFKLSQIKDIADVGDLSVRLHRMQAAANMADMRIAQLNKILDTPDWTYAHQAEYIKTLADRDYLVNRIKGNRAEIARALNVSKMASSYSASTMDAVAARMLEEGSGLGHLASDPAKFMRFAKDVKDLMENGNPEGARTKMENVMEPHWEQYLTSFHFDAMLSALSTHVKAPVDMGTGILRNVIEKAVALPISGTRRLIYQAMGRDDPGGVTTAELLAHIYGLGKGVSTLEVYRQMGKAVQDGHGGYVGPDGQPVSVNSIAQYGGASNPDIGLLSLPSHLVAAQDTFFRSAEMSAQLYSLGMRKAQRELGPNASLDALFQRAGYHAMHPDEEMVKTSQDLTNRTLLLNSNKFNNMIDRATAYKPGMSGWERARATVLKNIAPFIRVEANSLFNRVIQRSPLAFFDPYTQGQLKKGGAEADLALARIAYGTVALGLAWANSDKLTGNVSDDPKKRAELLAGGVTPRSIHEDGQYRQSSNLAISVMPWDQHNATAQMVKGIKDAWEKGAKANDLGTSIKLAMYSTLHGLSNMTWLSSVAPYVDGATAQENTMPGKAASVLADQAKTFVPNIVNQGQRMTDHQRDARPDEPGNIVQTVGRSVMSAVPGLAQQLPLKQSVYGEPLDTGASFEGVHIPDIPGIPGTPFKGAQLGFEGNRTPEPTNPQVKELTRLAKLTPAAQVTPVQSNMKIDGVNIKLTPAQQERYQHEAGQLIQYNVKTLQESGQWGQMSDKDRIAYVQDMQKQAKTVARTTLQGDPDFFNDKQRALLGTNKNAQ